VSVRLGMRVGAARATSGVGAGAGVRGAPSTRRAARRRCRPKKRRRRRDRCLSAAAVRPAQAARAQTSKLQPRPRAAWRCTSWARRAQRSRWRCEPQLPSAPQEQLQRTCLLPNARAAALARARPRAAGRATTDRERCGCAAGPYAPQRAPPRHLPPAVLRPSGCAATRSAPCTARRAPCTRHPNPPAPPPAPGGTWQQDHLCRRGCAAGAWSQVHSAAPSAVCQCCRKTHTARHARTIQRGSAARGSRGSAARHTHSHSERRVLLQKVHRAARRATSAAVARRSEVMTRGGATRATQACAAVAAWGCWCAAHLGCGERATRPTVRPFRRRRRRVRLFDGAGWRGRDSPQTRFDVAFTAMRKSERTSWRFRSARPYACAALQDGGGRIQNVSA